MKTKLLILMLFISINLSGQDTFKIDSVQIALNYLQKYEKQLGNYFKYEPINCLPSSGFKKVYYNYCPTYIDLKYYLINKK